MPTQTERPEPIEIDINDTSLLEGSEVEFDLKEDFQARSAPPPGRSDPNKPRLYKFRLFIDDDKVEKNLKDGFSAADPNGYYYKKQVICKLQDDTGKWQDSVAFANFSSGIPKGKKTSSMIGMLQYLRVRVQPRMTELAVARLFIKALKKLDGPVQIAECDWSAWDSTDTKRNDIGAVAIIVETGKAANYPKKADGTYQHIVHTKNGLELVAKLKVIRWIPPVLPKTEEAAKTNGVVKQVAVAPKPIVVAPIAPVEIVEDVLIDTGGGISMDGDGEVILDV